MIWTNENNLTMYVGRIIMPKLINDLVYTITIPPPLVDVVGLTCGTTDSSRLYFIQGKDMKVRELRNAKYHKNSKHITVESTFKIYTTDKKVLFDYYKEQFHKGIQYIESCIKIQEQEANAPLNDETNTIMDVHYALKNLQKYIELKASAMNVYRQTIEAIKKL